jgi:chromosome partitioning protein
VLASRGVGLAQAARPSPLRGLERLAVVSAGARLAQAEGELLGQVGFDEVLKHRLRAVSGAFDVALLDCPPSLGALTINALGAADVVVVPVQCEFFSARGVAKLLDLVDLVRERRNPALGVRLVPTLFDQRNGICKQVLQELRREFGEDVSPVTVGIDTRVREAQARGMPVTLYAASSRASSDYRDLARDLAGVLDQRREAERVHQAA